GGKNSEPIGILVPCRLNALYFQFVFEIDYGLQITSAKGKPVVGIVVASAFTIRQHLTGIRRKLQRVRSKEHNLFSVGKVFIHSLRQKAIHGSTILFGGS